MKMNGAYIPKVEEIIIGCIGSLRSEFSIEELIEDIESIMKSRQEELFWLGVIHDALVTEQHEGGRYSQPNKK